MTQEIYDHGTVQPLTDVIDDVARRSPSLQNGAKAFTLPRIAALRGLAVKNLIYGAICHVLVVFLVDVIFALDDIVDSTVDQFIVDLEIAPIVGARDVAGVAPVKRKLATDRQLLLL